MKSIALTAINRGNRGITMSLQLIIVGLSLFLGAFIFGGLIAFSLHRLPAPRMRAHRHARLAHR